MKATLKLLSYNVIVLMTLFLMMELVTRAFDMHSPNNLVEEINAYGEVVYFRRPNSSSLNKHEEENLAVYNNLGFHDVSHESDDTTKPNVAFFGDSYVEATQLQTSKVFTARLGSACADKLEIFNLGVSGTGLANQYRLYQRQLAKGQTFDFVYVVFYPGNDFTDNNPRITTHPKYTLVADSSGAIRQINRFPYSPAQQFVRGLRSVSALTNWIYELLYRSKRKKIIKDSQESYPVESAENRAETDSSIKDYPAREPMVAVYENSPKTQVDTAMIAGLTRIIDRWSEEVGKEKFRMMIIDQDRFLKSNANLGVFLDSLRAIGIGTVGVDIPREGHYYVHPRLDQSGLPVWTDYNYGHFNEAGHRRWAEIALKDLQAVGLQ